jgi:hypothetical protein
MPVACSISPSVTTPGAVAMPRDAKLPNKAGADVVATAAARAAVVVDGTTSAAGPTAAVTACGKSGGWWRRGVCEKGSVSRAAAWVDTQSDSMFGHAGSRPRQRGRETGGVAGCARRTFSGRTSPRLGLTRRRATRPPSVRVPQDRQGRPILPTPPPPSHRQIAGTVAWRVASGGAAGPRGPQRGQNGGDSRESEEAGGRRRRAGGTREAVRSRRAPAPHRG